MNVRRVALLTGAIALVASAAMAQTPVPPPQTPVTPASPSADDWVGIYAGGNLGHLSTSFNGPTAFPTFTASDGTTHVGESVLIGLTGPLSSGSGTIGLQVGYAGRLTRSLIGALEFQMTKASPAVAVTVGTQAQGLNDFISSDTLALKAASMKSLRARVGTAMTPDLFVYGTFGVAFSSVTATGTFPATVSGGQTFPAASGTDTHTMKGLTIGAGAEYAPFKQGSLRALTVGAEFRHASLGTVAFNFGTVDVYHDASGNPTLEPAIGNITVSVNEFDVRINVRFGAIK